MIEFHAQYSIYSPRRGHKDIYEVHLKENRIRITQGGKEAVCCQDKYRQIKWSGYEDDIGNPFVNILENDNIYVPDVIIDAMESLVQRNMNNKLKIRELESGLKGLFQWINIISIKKPKRKLWIGIF